MKQSNRVSLTLTEPQPQRDHIQGPHHAVIKMLEYGDYECPYCAQAYMIIKEVQERLGSKLRFVFRNFPVTKLRPNSYQVALAAETAAAQNMFWDMYDYLFKHGQGNTDDNLMHAAESLGLEIGRFNREYLDRTHSRHVDEDIESGKSSGVRSTPTFFINGDRYDGPWDLDNLLSALDEASVFAWRQTDQ